LWPPVELRSLSLPKTHTGDIAMKVKTNTQIPNVIVYAALYTIIFGVSIWVLIADRESPTNWLAYAAMIGSLLAGAIKFAIHSWKQQRTA
jgi:uncharacterized membrane protein YoaK (UPF0700 family)